MRLSALLSITTPKAGRSPQPPDKTPFVEIMRLKLKERVSGKSDKTREGGCLLEFSLLTNCLQENNYEEKMCQKQVESLDSCYKTYLRDRFHSKKAQEKGKLVPGEKNLTQKQVRRLFQMRPIV